MQAHRAQLSEAQIAERNETERLRLEAHRAQQSEVERTTMNEAQRQRTEAQRAQLSEAQIAERNETERLRLEAQRAQQTEAERAERNETERLRLESQRAQASAVIRAAQNAEQRPRTQNRRSNFDENEARAETAAARLRMQLKRNKVTKLCAAGFEVDDNGEAHYGGPLNFVCTHCGAKHFANEKVANKGLSFYGCCQHGTIKVEIPDYPEELKQLFDLAEFRKDIRVFNNAHAFGSFNADVVNFGINRPGPYTYIIQGQSYYQINTALRNEEGQQKSHGQLYIVDPEEAVENRLSVFNRLNPDITKTLSTVLSEINAQAKAFQMLYEQVKLQIEISQEMGIDPLNLTLHFGIKPGQDQRRFNLQASNEVAAVFGTNDDGEIPDSYITIYDKDQKKLKTVNAMDPNVEPWLYPIFFPTGQYIWHPDLKKINSNQRWGI
uniref:Uncharacterized protein n=1 Tax=Panagrolaimus davidi TaxID=227884 RepID=A0A914QZT4_9BILA